MKAWMKQWMRCWLSCGVLTLVLSVCVCCATVPEPQTVQSVPFRELNNYFVRNHFSPEGSQEVMTSQDDFAKIFGMAAFMGPKGRPTPIDFEQELVLAVIAPPLKQACSFAVREVVKGERSLVFRYTQTFGEPLTYTIRPCLLIAIPKTVTAPHIAFERIDAAPAP